MTRVQLQLLDKDGQRQGDNQEAIDQTRVKAAKPGEEWMAHGHSQILSPGSTHRRPT